MYRIWSHNQDCKKIRIHAMRLSKEEADISLDRVCVFVTRRLISSETEKLSDLEIPRLISSQQF